MVAILYPRLQWVITSHIGAGSNFILAVHYSGVVVAVLGVVVTKPLTLAITLKVLVQIL